MERHSREPGKGKLSRIEAIRILVRATEQDDPAWEGWVEEHYDEEADTMPSIFDVFASLGVTEAEYRQAAGVDGVIDWSKSSSPTP